jgi:hypothetical protein
MKIGRMNKEESMPVVLDKKKKTGHLVCNKCGTESKPYRVTSPAAPHLSVCEQAHEKDKWAYSIGFFAMLAGHDVYCPECVEASKRA